MGIGVEEWRQRIGLFSSPRTSKGLSCSSGLVLPTLFKPRLACVACVLAMLLLIGGVEQNPGPATKTDDLARRMDDLFQELRDTRVALSTKIDDSMRDLATKLLACEQQLTAHNDRLAAIERAQTTLETDIITLKASLQGASQPMNTTPGSPPIAMDNVVREINLRTSKQSNLIISGVRPSLQSDDDLVTNLLHDELSLDVIVTKCSRIGKATANQSPRLLQVTLASINDVRAALRDAKKLRQSNNTYVKDHVYLNADLTREQRALDFKLRTELRRRRSAGEQNLAIRNGRVIMRPAEQRSQPVAITMP